MLSTNTDINPLLAQLANPAFYLTDEFTELMRYLRQNEPVRWAQPWPDRGCWVVTRHADLKAIYDQPSIFTNGVAGTLIPADPNAHKGDRDAQGFGALLANTDQPRHGDLRRIFARYFSGPQIAKLEARTQQIVDDVINDLQGRNEFDFVTEVATHLPSNLVCEMLGVPKEDWAQMTDYMNSLACYADDEYQLGTTPAETFQIAMSWTFQYVAKLVAKRRDDPCDDLCSVAALSEIGSESISERDAAWGAWQLLAGGFETSRNVIAGGLLAMIEHPDQAALLRENPKLMQPAMEEMLRWTQPVTATLRVAAQDACIADRKVAEGDWIFLMLESANRDEAVFADPYRFDITRRPNQYLSFGHGIHNCIGRMLAMLEVKVMLCTLFERTSHIQLTGPLEFRSSTIAKGLKTLPVRVVWNG